MEKTIRLVCALVVLGLISQTPLSEAAKLHDPYENNIPAGSPSWCRERLNENLTNFEVLPGNGWDNLENKERGRVVKLTYFQCRTTADGRYLLPDGVITTPVKSSKLDVFSEVYSSWMDYKETTSKSINAAAKYSYGVFSIDGSFCAESQSVKENQIGKDSFITRTQARYVRYTVQVQPDASLHPAFRSRVIDIAKSIQMGENDVARYESQLLVRDFGTHVLTAIDAGAAIAQIRHVSSKFVSAYGEKETSRRASLSTSFSLNTSGSYANQEDDCKVFNDNVTYSTIKTYGGPSYQPRNFRLDDWAEGIEDNMVAIDKEGTPLYYMISASSFPELPSHLIPDVFNQIRNAVYLYYKYNTYRGCTDPDKPNFNRNANVDDGTCKPSSTDFKFGGVYQSCEQDSCFKSDYCSKRTKKNPITGDLSCPSGFVSVPLDYANIVKTETKRECHKVWYKLWIGKKCIDVPVSGGVAVTSYWCAATGDERPSSGYMFGGLYTPNAFNPVTGASSCPPNFEKLPLHDGLTVCVTQDFDSGFPFSAPFGGFYSCTSGNPLAGNASGDCSQWPQSCPAGFSSHIALISNECELEYCAQIRSLNDKGLPSLRRPPFMAYPNYKNVEATEVFIDSSSNTWTRLPAETLKVQDATLDLETAALVFRNSPDFEEQMQMINIPAMQMTSANASSENENSKMHISKQTSNMVANERTASDLRMPPETKDHQALPNGTVAVLSVVSTLLLVCVIAMVTMYRRRRVHKSGENQTLLG